jgi:hypothetical protein
MPRGFLEVYRTELIRESRADRLLPGVRRSATTIRS